MRVWVPLGIVLGAGGPKEPARQQPNGCGRARGSALGHGIGGLLGVQDGQGRSCGGAWRGHFHAPWVVGGP